MIDLFRAWTTVMYLERAGDEVKRLHRTALETEINKKEIDELISSINELLDLYKNVMKLYHVEEQNLKKTKNYEYAEKCRLFQKKMRTRIVSNDQKQINTSEIYERMTNTTSYLEEILRLTYDFI